MPSCWSCLVILENGAQVCPICGADQTRPVAYTNPDLPQPRTLRDCGIAISTIVVGIGIMAGILWHDLGTQSVSPALEAAGIAAKSMRELREALSDYALSTKDAYPSSLQALGDRTSQPTQEAQSAAYNLKYNAASPSSDGAIHSFVILAQPKNGDYLSLYVDESGIVRATVESRAATLEDAPF
jgi:hypothetical protein